MTSSGPLILSDKLFIAAGAGRRVFRHPDNPNLVLKIQKPRRKKNLAQIRSLFSRDKRRFAPIMFSWIEIDEYAAMVARRGELPDFCSQFRGFAATSEGLAAVFDAAIEADGSIAPTLRTYARTQGVTPAITAAIDRFWDQVIAFRGVVWDPNLNNLLVTGGATPLLFLVDGLGERTFIKRLTLSDRAYQQSVAKGRAEMHSNYAIAAKQIEQDTKT